MEGRKGGVAYSFCLGYELIGLMGFSFCMQKIKIL